MDELGVLLDRIYAYLARLHAPVATALQPGLSDDAIEERVKDLPFRLPREVYTLYRWRNGVSPDHFDTALFPGELADWVFNSLENTLARYREQVDLARDVGGDDWTLIWHPHWFPAFDNVVPTSLCVLGQAHQAETAPILYVDVEGVSHEEQYASLTHLMRIVAECYETGAFLVTADGSLEQDGARVGAIRRRHQGQRADAAIAALHRGMSDPEYMHAINDVIHFYDLRATEPLLHVLEQSDYTDTSAIVALADVAGERAVEPLLHAVRMGPTMERTLTGMGATWAETLRQMHREDPRHSHARAAAMQAVVRLAERINVRLPAEPFIVALHDPQTYVRLRAVWALERIGTADARAGLAASMEDADQAIRQAARHALARMRPVE